MALILISVSEERVVIHRESVQGYVLENEIQFVLLYQVQIK